ncbi:MAG: ATP-binding protein, partial [Planctomycetota bacterium]
MLTFDRGQSLNIRPCDFNQWAASVVEMVRPQADRRQVEIVTRFGRAIEPVPMDTERMTDAVLNLLLNAIEAVEPETGRITVGTEYDGDTQRAILRVSDNGRGVEDAEKIFEPFYSETRHQRRAGPEHCPPDHPKAPRHDRGAVSSGSRNGLYGADSILKPPYSTIRQQTAASICGLPAGRGWIEAAVEPIVRQVCKVGQVFRVQPCIG